MPFHRNVKKQQGRIFMLRILFHIEPIRPILL